jgi:hypothetical protein
MYIYICVLISRFVYMEPFYIHQKHAITTVSELVNKYHDDPYMSAKLHNWVCVQLPTIMENIKKTHVERQQRIADLAVEQEDFMERYLNTHRYFYVSTTDTYVMYDGIHYEVTHEDDVLHHILTTITAEKQLMEWKQRTKVYIMKRIKDAPLLKSVPESNTIQNVLDYFYPAIFETKQEAKYFLTIIGDNLFRKNGDLVYFIQPKAKTFIREISNISVLLLGANATHSFKYKYYDHNYANCRLLKINDSVDNEKTWGELLRSLSVDILCVAAHYSIRYGSADDYITKFNNNPALETYTFFLRNTNQEQLVCKFISEYLQVSLNGTNQLITVSPLQNTHQQASNLLLSLSSGEPNPARSIRIENTPIAIPSAMDTIQVSRSPEIALSKTPQFHSSAIARETTTMQISWKNMHYLWRHFLDHLQLPPIIFQQNLKTLLIQKLATNYKEDTDHFIGVSSRVMPVIRGFISFWETTITYEDNSEYEIDELCMLYKRWVQTRSAGNASGVSPENMQIPEQGMSVGIERYINRNSMISPPDDIFTSKNNTRHLEATNSTREWGAAITEKQMLDFIRYYFPNTEIEKDKYVYNIRCSLWDKQMDVQTALYHMHDTLANSTVAAADNDTERSIGVGIVTSHSYATSLYDAYVWYCKYYSDTSASETGGGLNDTACSERRRRTSMKHPIVSKSYFEKYVMDSMPQYVVDNKYISNDWLTDHIVSTP